MTTLDSQELFKEWMWSSHFFNRESCLLFANSRLFSFIFFFCCKVFYVIRLFLSEKINKANYLLFTIVYIERKLGVCGKMPLERIMETWWLFLELWRDLVADVLLARKSSSLKRFICRQDQKSCLMRQPSQLEPMIESFLKVWAPLFIWLLLKRSL